LAVLNNLTSGRALVQSHVAQIPVKAVARPALVTATAAEITGTPARTFRDWVTDHAAEFRD
jgi:hypothetical protein